MKNFDYKKLFATAGIFTIGGLLLVAINAKTEEPEEKGIFQTLFAKPVESVPTQPTPTVEAVPTYTEQPTPTIEQPTPSIEQPTPTLENVPTYTEQPTPTLENVPAEQPTPTIESVPTPTSEPQSYQSSPTPEYSESPTYPAPPSPAPTYPAPPSPAPTYPAPPAPTYQTGGTRRQVTANKTRRCKHCNHEY